MTIKKPTAVVIFGKRIERSPVGFRVAFGPLEYHISDNQPRIEPKCITWLYRDPSVGVRVAGRSAPFVGQLNECITAIEHELESIYEALDNV